MINLIVDQNETAKYIANKMNLPEKLIRDEQEQKELVDRLQQMQTAPEEGEAPPGAWYVLERPREREAQGYK